MEQWLLRTPKILVAFVVGGVLVFLMTRLQPLPTLCSTQLDVFKTSQEAFLYQKGSTTTPLPPEFEIEFKKCAELAGMGGCFQLFQGLRRMIREIQSMTAECQVETVRARPVRSVLERSYTLMTHLAWGGAPPVRVEEKVNWFERADLHLYCELDRNLRLGRGDNGIQRLQRDIMDTLPGGESLSSDDVWARSLMSSACQRP